MYVCVTKMFEDAWIKSIIFPENTQKNYKERHNTPTLSFSVKYSRTSALLSANLSSTSSISSSQLIPVTALTRFYDSHICDENIQMKLEEIP